MRVEQFVSATMFWFEKAISCSLTIKALSYHLQTMNHISGEKPAGPNFNFCLFSSVSHFKWFCKIEIIQYHTKDCQKAPPKIFNEYIWSQQWTILLWIIYYTVPPSFEEDAIVCLVENLHLRKVLRKCNYKRAPRQVSQLSPLEEKWGFKKWANLIKVQYQIILNFVLLLVVVLAVTALFELF